MRASMRTLIAVTAMALVAVGCGGDDDVLASSETPADGEAGQESIDDGSGEETQTGDDAPAMTGDSDSPWCQRARQIAESDEPSPMSFDFLGLDPAAVEALFTANLEVIQEMRDLAPPEIDGQVDTMAETFQTFVDMASAAEWNLVAMGSDPEFLAVVEDPAIGQAADDIDAYTRDVCGVDFGAVGAPAVPDVPTDPGEAGGMAEEFLGQFGLPANFLTEAQAVCLNDELSKAYPDGLPADLSLTPETVELFETAGAACGIGAP